MTSVSGRAAHDRDARDTRLAARLRRRADRQSLRAGGGGRCAGRAPGSSGTGHPLLRYRALLWSRPEREAHGRALAGHRPREHIRHLHQGGTPYRALTSRGGTPMNDGFAVHGAAARLRLQPRWRAALLRGESRRLRARLRRHPASARHRPADSRGAACRGAAAGPGGGTARQWRRLRESRRGRGDRHRRQRAGRMPRGTAGVSTLDCIMLAGRYTLLEQQHSAEIMAQALRAQRRDPDCRTLQLGTLRARRPPGHDLRLRTGDAAMLDRARRIYAECASEQVDVGPRRCNFRWLIPPSLLSSQARETLDEVDSAVQRLTAPIPERLWERLKRAPAHCSGCPGAQPHDHRRAPALLGPRSRRLRMAHA